MISKIGGVVQQKPWLIVILLFVVYYIFDYTTVGQDLNNVLNWIFKLVIIPILGVGGLIALYHNSKNILSIKEAKESVFLYVLWWVWLLVLFVFSIACLYLAFNTWISLF